jgi:hypothetical protein
MCTLVWSMTGEMCIALPMMTACCMPDFAGAEVCQTVLKLRDRIGSMCERDRCRQRDDHREYHKQQEACM